MSKEAVDKMIQFIESKERELQAAKLAETQSRTDIVKSILDELDRVTSNENQ